MYAQSKQNFTPIETNNFAAVTTTSSIKTATNKTVGSVRLYNSGTSPVFVKFGDTSVVATVNDMCIPVGAVETFSLGKSASGTLNNTVAAITATLTAALYCTFGKGLNS